MNAAVRPFATAGVALVGASAIAISPLAPTMPSVQEMQRTMSSASVGLSAATNPIENWIQVFQRSAANLGAIGQQVFDSPAPILSQVVANQIASLKTLQAALESNAAITKSIFESIPSTINTASSQLQSGDITGAFGTINDTVVIPLALSVVQALSDSTQPLVSIVDNFAKAFATVPNAVFQVVVPLTFPLLSTINALVETTQEVYDGAVAADPAAVITSLVNLPANLVDGFLNGRGTLLGFLPTPGLLTPYDPNFGFLGSGPISSLIALRDVIAQAIGAVPPSAAAVPAAAKSVTVSTAGPKALAAASARAATKPASSEGAAEPAAGDSTETAAPIDAGVAESSTGSTGLATNSKTTPAVTAGPASDSTASGYGASPRTDKAGSPTTRGHGSKAGAGTKGSTAKSARSAKAS